MKKADRQSAKHYFWREICDGWHLVERDDLSIIAEKMPPNTLEDMHYHRKAMTGLTHSARTTRCWSF